MPLRCKTPPTNQHMPSWNIIQLDNHRWDKLRGSYREVDSERLDAGYYIFETLHNYFWARKSYVWSFISLIYCNSRLISPIFFSTVCNTSLIKFHCFYVFSFFPGRSRDDIIGWKIEVLYIYSQHLCLDFYVSCLQIYHQKKALVTLC